MSISDLFSGLTGAVTQGVNTAVGGPFDFTGSLMNAGQTFDPSQFNPATFSGTYGNLYGGTDQYGQTAQEVQSSDPGNQLQGTQQPQQNQTQPQQPQAPQNAQPSPGSLLAAINARGYQGNPYVIGGGGGVPNVPPGVNPALLRQDPVGPGQMPQGVVPGSQPILPQVIQPPQVSDGGYNAIDAQANRPAPPAAREPSTTGIGRGAGGEPLHGGGEVTEVPPAGQQAAQMPPQLQQIVGNFLRSPMGQFIDRLTGGGISQLLQQQGLGNVAAAQRQFGNQVPFGYTSQNMPPWATQQQADQYARTGQLPAQRPFPNQGLAPGFRREPNGQLTYKGQPADIHLGGPTGGESWSPEAIRRGDEAERNAQQNGVFGPPPPAAYGRGQRTTAGTPYLYTTDEAGRPIPKGTNFAGTQPGSELTTADGRYRTDTLQGRQANIMATQGPGYTDSQGNRRQGMSPNAIAGVFQNVMDESHWNPSESHPDQPGYTGQANLSHGLYQEGGPDWPLFQQFLNGRDWRNPDLQTQFMMQHFARRNPRAWNEMNNAPHPGQAAVIFLNSYLIPRIDLRQARAARYMRRGVPTVQQQLAMQ